MSTEMIGFDLASGPDCTVLTSCRMADGQIVVTDVRVNPSPSKLARLWRREKQNAYRINRAWRRKKASHK